MAVEVARWKRPSLGVSRSPVIAGSIAAAVRVAPSLARGARGGSLEPSPSTTELVGSDRDEISRQEVYLGWEID
jgi:hypothetical protein